MATTIKSQHSDSGEHEPVSSFYGANRPTGELMERVDDDVQTFRDKSGRFTPNHETPLSERVAESIDRATVSLQKAAKKTAATAQSGARSTAQAVRDHPAMTAAVLGGLATAAYAGVRIFKASKDSNGRIETSVTPKRRIAVATKPAPKRKH